MRYDGKMKVHHLQLGAVPFHAIVSGTKTIESRLFDDKRQQIRLGDEIIFINRQDPTQTVVARVIGLLRYQYFHDMFSHNDPAKFGGESVAWLEEQIGEFYSIEEQRENGVVGIEFELK